MGGGEGHQERAQGGLDLPTVTPSQPRQARARKSDGPGWATRSQPGQGATQSQPRGQEGLARVGPPGAARKAQLLVDAFVRVVVLSGTGPGRPARSMVCWGRPRLGRAGRLGRGRDRPTRTRPADSDETGRLGRDRPTRTRPADSDEAGRPGPVRRLGEAQAGSMGRRTPARHVSEAGPGGHPTRTASRVRVRHAGTGASAQHATQSDPGRETPRDAGRGCARRGAAVAAG